MNRTLKLSLLCGGIFLAGAVAGGFAVKNFPRPGNQPRPEAFGPLQLRRLAEGLDLTKEQRKAILPLLQKTGEQLRVMRKESIAQATREVAAMDAAVGALLTPAQRERLAVLRAEDRVRMKKIMEEHQRRQNERESESGFGEGRRDKEGFRRPSKAGDAGKTPAPGLPAEAPGATPPSDAPPPTDAAK
jgi:Spy/CpxP family protein refolding chaperone